MRPISQLCLYERWRGNTMDGAYFSNYALGGRGAWSLNRVTGMAWLGLPRP
jgi:hypothetical protein